MLFSVTWRRCCFLLQYALPTSPTRSDKPYPTPPRSAKCTRDKCPIANTGLCLRRNAVYQLTCNSCDQQYIGSTTRFIHDRVREHLNNDNSSVKKHISSCQNNDHKGINIKIIMSENDPANLRLYEAFYIRKYKPTLNSREECTEFAELLF